ncbi:DNA ligase (ATP) CDC9 [Ascoidea rubescens DSM 1968]|uniref:DNA ligase n=1 Tax=Ascoidea rubescens DSM 1968 TaxID=1344418 RepID=A0A1D2VB76_9ASCO|nr:ATP-dependent DNA ligase [Ascoidea rubescens DSM 1968]ODV58859.1 ATP-dependent DNA ligase [Ascoidea rubescens DSM 1968]
MSIKKTQKKQHNFRQQSLASFFSGAKQNDKVDIKTLLSKPNPSNTSVSDSNDLSNVKIHKLSDNMIDNEQKEKILTKKDQSDNHFEPIEPQSLSKRKRTTKKDDTNSETVEKSTELLQSKRSSKSKIKTKKSKAASNKKSKKVENEDAIDISSDNESAIEINDSTEDAIDEKPAQKKRKLTRKKLVNANLDDSESDNEKINVASINETNADDTDPPEDDEMLRHNSSIHENEIKEAEELASISLEETKTKIPRFNPEDNSIPYKSICDLFQEIENESSRLKIIKLCSEFFLDVLKFDPKSLIIVVYLFINRLGPDYEGLELGLGETLLIKTITQSSGRSAANIKKDLKDIGDLGEVAQKSRVTQPAMFKPKTLDALTVFNNLKNIANSKGSNSQQKKINHITKMLTACEGNEAKFLIRSLEGKLRIGLAEKSVLVSLAQALVTFELVSDGKKSKKASAELIVKAEDKIREAFCQVPNYKTIIDKSIEYGVLKLDEHVRLSPGVPLKPMLAKPTKSISEILDRFQNEVFTCEYKYDGERAQIHLIHDNGEEKIKVFSRNSEDMSQRYPDIIDSIRGFIKKNKIGMVKSLVLDCEAVAWDRDESKILPFQVLSTRKRKDVNKEDIKVQVCIFAFDLLCLNDEPLITKSLKERRDLIEEYLNPVPGKFQLATKIDTANIDDIQGFLDSSIKDSCEGLMIKVLEGKESQYEPSKRSRNWLKLKKDYLKGIGDSLDLVVVGAYYGKGKRTGKYGGFLLASYNQQSGDYETTCKLGTGFSDEMLLQLYEKLSKLVIAQPRSYYSYDSGNAAAEPDVWFEPEVVFEVLTADLSLSPIYKAGCDTFGKGISLRFPRFIKLRDDKGSEDATSSDQLVEFYERQSSIS